MRRTLLLLTVLAYAWLPQAVAQSRYLTQVFSGVTLTENVVYGNNISVITGAPAAQDLKMNIYRPETDTNSNRPVVIIAHTGNFLPAILNGSPTGTMKDSTVVELCVRLAKMGYVAISMDYRQGWAATNPSQTVQTSTLLIAAYRGIQDARTCIRFLRKSVAEGGNPYGIDPDKIVLGGVGTGGYISLGSAFLDDYEKIKLLKFSDVTTGLPYVDTTLHGNVWSTNTTPLNTPNHVAYNSEFNMAFNLGGALGDSSWMDPGDIPVVSFHTPLDPFAPYEIGIVIVPTTNNTVIDEAAGSYTVAEVSNTFGNNDVFVNANISDVYTTAANKLNGGNEGLFPFDRPFTPGQSIACLPGVNIPYVPEGSPWSWWNEAAFIATWDAATGGVPFPGVVMNCRELASNPDMSPTKGRTYIDSVIGYLAPRMYAALDLSATSLEDDLLNQGISLYPNPAADAFVISNEMAANPIREVYLQDMTGRVVIRKSGLSLDDQEINVRDLPGGVYLVTIQAEKGRVTRKVVIQ
ncbi:MAG: T9SS type A sorting domain-containing protein [Bacteroidia bacterium]|nr:T9SS type A sorting domain-containing protein [Bacteroidia bacterium]